MHKLSQKVLCSGLSLVLVAGLNPVAAFAAETAATPSTDLAVGTQEVQKDYYRVNVQFTSQTSLQYTGQAQVPTYRVLYYNQVLASGTDYTTVKYQQLKPSGDDWDDDDWTEVATPIEPGTYRLKITLAGAFASADPNYPHTRTSDVFYINAKAIDSDDITFADAKTRFKATGSAIKPKLIVKDDEKTLTEGTDYTVKYQGYKWVATEYGGLKISDPEDVTPVQPNAYVDGGYRNYQVVVVPAGSYAKKSAEPITKDFYIFDGKKLSNAEYAWGEDNSGNFASTGKALSPEPVVTMDGVTLKKGTDYKISYYQDKKMSEADETNADKAEQAAEDAAKAAKLSDFDTAKAKAIARWKAEHEAVTPLAVGSYYCWIEGIGAYAGTDLLPNLLTSEEDYSYSDNYYYWYNLDLPQFAIYAGKTFDYYYYTYISMTDSYFTNGSNFAYTGKSIQPKPVVTYRGKTLKEGTDYVLVYPAETVNPDTYTITIKGIGAYYGTTYAHYTIYATDRIENAIVTMPNGKSSYVYTGEAVKVEPASVELYGKTLKKGTDYTIEYEDANGNVIDNPIQIGSYQMVLVGKGKYANHRTSEYFRIVDKNSLYAATISMQDIYTWDGSVVKPEPVVTLNGKQLKKGKDYTIAYYAAGFQGNNWNAGGYKGEQKISKPKNAGSYYVKITPKGTKYQDSIDKGFNIKPLNMSEVEVSLKSDTLAYSGKNKKPTVVVKYTNAKGKLKTMAASNYTVANPLSSANIGDYMVTVIGKHNLTGTVNLSYQVVSKNTKIKKLTAKKKAFTVKWNKVAKNNSGYQVQYSVNKDMSKAKTKTVKGAKKSSLNVKKLGAHTKYYVQVRTWSKANGTKYYGNWSKAKAVTTK